MFCICISSESIITSSTFNLQASSVDYSVDIHDKFALCKLVQTYSIDQNVNEASYEFPVDYNSAFCDLTVETPREQIKGMVREKEEARQLYENAKKEGRQTFLTEESSTDRDIYKLSMGNLLKDDIIKIQYIYITELEHSDGQNIFYIPSFISPRYGGKFIPKPEHSVKLHLTINNKIQKFKCSMPNIMVEIFNKKAIIDHESKLVLDKDIEICYDTKFENNMFSFQASDYHMGITSITTNVKQNKNVDEIVFILDCSGSMEGERIEASKKAIIHCLNTMLKNCYLKFNIIRYGSGFSFYRNEMVPCIEYEINDAINYCKNIKADLGGTETLNALGACLELSKNAILITDGDTSDNEKLYKLCQSFDCLCILGIGSGINRANINDMAFSGSGIARFSQDDTNIVGYMDKIINCILTSSIREPKAKWETQVLTSKSALISNQPYVEYVISNGIIRNYKLDNSGLEKSIYLDANKNIPFDPIYMGALVAKRIIQENGFSQDIDVKENEISYTKKEMITLAVKFNIITKYTSLVAVGNKVIAVPPEEMNNYCEKLIGHYSLSPESVSPQSMSPQSMSLECCELSSIHSHSESIMEKQFYCHSGSPRRSNTMQNIGEFLGNGFKKIATIFTPKPNDNNNNNDNGGFFERIFTKKTIDKDTLGKEFNIINEHFDEATGTFNASIIQLIQNIELTDVSDTRRRTHYVLSWIKKTYPQNKNLFIYFYKLVAAKNLLTPPGFYF